MITNMLGKLIERAAQMKLNKEVTSDFGTNKLSKGKTVKAYLANVIGEMPFFDDIEVAEVEGEFVDYSLLRGKMAWLDAVKVFLPAQLIPSITGENVGGWSEEAKFGITSIDWDRALMGRLISAIEKKMNVYVLPFFKNANVSIGDSKYASFIAIPSVGDRETSIQAAVVKAIGAKLSKESMKDLPKTLTYWNTPIREDVKWHERMVVISGDAFVAKATHDGCYFKAYSNKVEAEISWGLDEEYKIRRRNTTHVRGNVIHDGVSWEIKGTGRPILRKEFVECMVDKKAAHRLFDRMEKENIIVCSPEVAKKAPIGEYDITLFYHDHDEAHGNGFVKGKFMFEQSTRRVANARGTYLDAIEDRAKAYGEVFSTAKGYFGHMLKEADAVNDEDFVSEFNDVASLVMNGMPAGLHSSSANAVGMTFKKIMKGAMELPAGFEHRRKKKGAIQLLKKEHLDRIPMIRGFHAHHPALDNVNGGYAIMLPNWIYDQIEGMLKANGLTWDDVTAILRRCPILYASIQKVAVLRADDDIPIIRCGRKLTVDIGADSDGDKVEFLICRKSFFDFDVVTMDSVNADEKALPAKDQATISNLVGRYNTRCNGAFTGTSAGVVAQIAKIKSLKIGGKITKENKAAALRKLEARKEAIEKLDPSHVALYNLAIAEAIGLADTILGRLVDHLVGGGMDAKVVNIFGYRFATTFVQDVIEAKKHGSASIPNFHAITAILKEDEIGWGSKYIKMLRGKMTAAETISSLTSLIVKIEPDVMPRAISVMEEQGRVTDSGYEKLSICLARYTQDHFVDSEHGWTIDRVPTKFLPQAIKELAKDDLVSHWRTPTARVRNLAMLTTNPEAAKVDNRAAVQAYRNFYPVHASLAEGFVRNMPTEIADLEVTEDMRIELKTKSVELFYNLSEMFGDELVEKLGFSVHTRFNAVKQENLEALLIRMLDQTKTNNEGEEDENGKTWLERNLHRLNELKILVMNRFFKRMDENCGDAKEKIAAQLLLCAVAASNLKSENAVSPFASHLSFVFSRLPLVVVALFFSIINGTDPNEFFKNNKIEFVKEETEEGEDESDEEDIDEGDEGSEELSESDAALPIFKNSSKAASTKAPKAKVEAAPAVKVVDTLTKEDAAAVNAILGRTQPEEVIEEEDCGTDDDFFASLLAPAEEEAVNAVVEVDAIRKHFSGFFKAMDGRTYISVFHAFEAWKTGKFSDSAYDGIPNPDPISSDASFVAKISQKIFASYIKAYPEVKKKVAGIKLDMVAHTMFKVVDWKTLLA